MSIPVASLALLLGLAQDVPVDPAHEAHSETTVEQAVDEAAAAPEQEEAEDLVHVAIDTSMGRIVLALDQGNAPVTTANFLTYVDDGYLEFAEFYRAMPFGDAGLAQFGVRRGDKLHDPVAHETTADTGLRHERGSISLIATEPGKGQADFFIAMGDIAGFDCCANGPGFAVFGHVAEGMDVVEAIYGAPVDPEKGEGVMKGQMLADPVKITGAERVDSPVTQ